MNTVTESPAVAAAAIAAEPFVQVPETTLPSGLVVPAFLVGRYLTSEDDDGKAAIVVDRAPWVEISFHEARAAATAAGYNLITESQALALACNIASQADNWTGGAVGEGDLYQGLREGDFDEAQAASFEPENVSKRRWFVLSNGERIYDVAGNAYTWVFDDVQGDENGIVARAFTGDSPSISTAPYPSMERGAGWQPRKTADWAGLALVRGGSFSSEDRAGVFRLDGGFPDGRNDLVGFRCTN
jgi:formylglycine-generating enzyme required for sulfatase activity